MSTGSTVGLGHCWRRAPVGLAGLIVLGATSATRVDGAQRCAFSWLPVGEGLNGSVTEMIEFNGRLVATGSFEFPGYTETVAVSIWDGMHWRPLGADGPGPLLGSGSTTIVDDADGSLLVGGQFEPSEDSARCIARWTGAGWEFVGGAFSGGESGLPRVFTLCRSSVGGQSVLLAGGYFGSAGGVALTSIGAWDGHGWSSLGRFDPPYFVFGPPLIGAIVIADLGAGDVVLVGGTFDEVDGIPASAVAAWDGDAWSALGTNISLETNIHPVVLYLGQHGGELWAVGSMPFPGRGVCVWDGINWARRDNGVASYASWYYAVLDLAWFDDGRATDAYIGGMFAAEHIPLHIARWDRELARWQSVGAGLGTYPGGGQLVGTVQSFDDGTTIGEALYAGGIFRVASGRPVRNVARWGCLRGDVNCDARVDFFDIDPFLVALFAPGDYPTLYPDCAVIHADANGDGAVDLFDVDPFIERILDRL